jgi:hypothetical protein
VIAQKPVGSRLLGSRPMGLYLEEVVRLFRGAHFHHEDALLDDQLVRQHIGDLPRSTLGLLLCWIDKASIPIQSFDRDACRP